jgi:hypothetical protein
MGRLLPSEAAEKNLLHASLLLLSNLAFFTLEIYHLDLCLFLHIMITRFPLHLTHRLLLSAHWPEFNLIAIFKKSQTYKYLVFLQSICEE